MLVDLLTDPRQRSKPARAWTYDTKHHWPCHSVVEVNSLDTILVTVDEHHLELLFVKTSSKASNSICQTFIANHADRKAQKHVHCYARCTHINRSFSRVSADDINPVSLRPDRGRKNSKAVDDSEQSIKFNLPNIHCEPCRRTSLCHVHSSS